MSKNYGLELYKLIVTPDKTDLSFSYVSEYGWINDNEFCVWVDYSYLSNFVFGLKSIFGYDIFDDGGFGADIQSDSVCIDLCEALDGYLDFEEVFPKGEYQH